MNLHAYLISEKSTVKDALAQLEKNHKQFLAVVDHYGDFIGTLTDGDLRRGLLKGLTLSSNVVECVNKSSVTAISTASLDELKEKLSASKISAIPILSGRRVTDVIFSEDINLIEKVDAKVLIMAGGRGERLLPLTQGTPKPLIAVNGVPIIDRIIRQFGNQGFSEIWISVHHLSEQIINHVGDGSKFGVTVNFLIEDEPLGTAGSLRLLPVSTEEQILVCNADLFNNVNYRDMFLAHKVSKKFATIGVTRHETKIPYGVVNELNSIYKSLVEKPTLVHKVAAGVNIFESRLIQLIPENRKINIPDFYELISSNGHEIGVYELQGTWIDIGTKETLEKAKKLPTSN